ncbi:hypothetical protein JHK87_056539 [Glycine soja]|nr:hypothetical protein JHK87_056539 [Glycine soja]
MEFLISGVTYCYVNGTSNSETTINLICGAGAGCTDIFMDKKKNGCIPEPKKRVQEALVVQEETAKNLTWVYIFKPN